MPVYVRAVGEGDPVGGCARAIGVHVREIRLVDLRVPER